MQRWPSSQYFTYAMILTLIGSVFSTALTFQPSQASHSNITLELSAIDLVYDPGDVVPISGSIEDVDNDIDQVTINIDGPDSDDFTIDLDSGGDFSDSYEISTSAGDGIFSIEVEYDTDSVFAYFLTDEDDDDVTVLTDDESYQPGDTVEISGRVENPETGEDQVEITVVDPEGDTLSYADEERADVNSDDEFSFDLDLESDAIHGRYAVTVVYDSTDEGYIVFDVEEGSPITAEVAESSYEPGDTVVVSGEVADVEQGEEVFIVVEYEDGQDVFDDSKEPTTSGSFEFEFSLEDDAQEGEYTVTIDYMTDDLELTFDVSEDGSSGGTNTGSGSSSGLTARLNKASFLAGEAITVTGVVPSIEENELVNIVVLQPDGSFAGSSAFPEPDSDKKYSATLRLKSDLEEDQDYRVVVSYDGKEVEIEFDITGQADSSTTGPVTVKTDRTSYTSGSTVILSGKVSPELLLEDKQLAIQV
ncbi:MAG: hypothetical protein MN733_36050, partial [Nitrososphaera sp.]|nr:hypothetical protein [Nitrososphaera sp.]